MINILNVSKKTFLFLCLIFSIINFVPFFASAHQPKVNESVLTIVTEPEVSKAFYGVLTGEPHVYQINSPEPFMLYVNTLVPDTLDQKKDVSALIIKNGNVDEPLAVLDGMNFEWKKFFEPFGRDWYWQGPEYKSKVEAGNYEIRVWSSNNDSKYSLAIGEIEAFDMQSGIDSLNLIPQLKNNFFESSPAGFILSPFGISYVVVLFILAFIAGFLFRFIMRKFKNTKILSTPLDSSKIQKNKNIGKMDRWLRVLIGVGLFVFAIMTTWSPVLIFFAGFCIFEGLFSWCAFYQMIGRNSCPIE